MRAELTGGRLIPSVGFLGPRGTYTESAMEILLGTNRIAENPLSVRNRAVVEQVALGEFDLGVVASENSTEGDVTETLKALRGSSLRILGEAVVPIHHMLIANPGYEITEIRSHSQALGQCSEFLDKNFPRAKRVEVFSTAEAAMEVKRAKHVAAIGSKKVAEMNNLHILVENIGDNPHNATRFFLIGRGETTPTGNDTTMITFEPPNTDEAGVLGRCTDILSERGINLTKIDSHPLGKMGEYLFLASFDGHEKDPQVEEALRVLKEYSRVKILGSYKKADVPEDAYIPGTWNGD